MIENIIHNVHLYIQCHPNHYISRIQMYVKLIKCQICLIVFSVFFFLFFGYSFLLFCVILLFLRLLIFFNYTIYNNIAPCQLWENTSIMESLFFWVNKYIALVYLTIIRWCKSQLQLITTFQCDWKYPLKHLYIQCHQTTRFQQFRCM